MKSHRRNFLKTAGALAAGAGGMLGATSVKAEETARPADAAIPIVDTHQHLWDLRKFELPWIEAGDPLRRNYLVADYLEAAKGLNIVKAVYMEVDVAPRQHPAEAEAIIELCRRGGTPTCAAVIGGRPGTPGFAAYIKRFRGSPYVKGVRHIPSNSAVWQEENYVKDIRLLGEQGMSFDLCGGPAILPAAAELVDKCPATRFILDHCGGGDPKATGADAAAWRQGIAQLARRKNVICKISGVVAQARKGWTAADLAPIVNHCLDSFGPDRVVFGSDWPVCTSRATLRQWVEALKEIIRSRDPRDQRKLLHDNAVQFYGLK